MSWAQAKLESRWWWPTCPIHGELYMGGKDGWVYCKYWGWHPARGWRNG